MRRECRGRFPHHRLQRKPLVSDPGIHHSTCVTHVPWCMSGSLIWDGGETFPAFPVHAQPSILRIWLEAHDMERLSASLSFCEGIPQVTSRFSSPLRWRHNVRDSVSNHQPHDCLLNRLFRRRSKKTSKVRVTGKNGQLRWKYFHLMTSSCKKPVMRTVGFVFVSMNKLLKRHLSCWWF